MAELSRDDGVRLYYEDHGRGPAVLLTHGFGATAEMWAGQVEAFRDQYRIVIWDMRGHGRSDYPEDETLYSEARTVGDMAALLDHLGIKQAVVGGLSLGGYMSLAFNLRHARRMRGLMLFDTGPGFRKDAAREAWNAYARERGRRLDEEGLAVQSASAEVGVSHHRSAEGLARAARGMLTQADSRIIDSLGRVRVPTLVLVGARDERFLAATSYMANKIPMATKVVIPDAGHGANLDQPRLFNAAMGAFLDGLPQGLPDGATA